MKKALILVVDDEPKLVRLVKEVLSATDYEVITASGGKEAIEKAALEQPDLILLDIVLADEVSGYKVSKEVRKFSNVPIIMLTAKACESDLIQGFESGADDYLTKPFSSKEMLMRVRAVLKRAQIDAKDTLTPEINCGSLSINIARRTVFLGEEEIKLTKTEFELLAELAKNKHKVMLHEQLLMAVWGQEYRNDVDYLRAYIRYLRRKLEKDPANPEYIITHQGVGYELVCPDKK
ncbi:MAG: response regulator transcription factor [Anaerolineales bacterium]|jgi:two-component system KDP operon response regulator KdpE